MKNADDVCWLVSGPRDGLKEITIPENELGSSIVLEKVNPAQCEVLTVAAVQIKVQYRICQFPLLSFTPAL